MMDGGMDSARAPSGGPARREALVVGAGPVGLCAALALRRRGRAVTMLEALEVPLQRALGTRIGGLYAEMFGPLEERRD